MKKLVSTLKLEKKGMAHLSKKKESAVLMRGQSVD